VLVGVRRVSLVVRWCTIHAMSVSRRRCPLVLAVAAVVFGLSCRSGPPVAGRAKRVVIVSYDGAGADLVWSWIERGVVDDRDGLRWMAEEGFAVRRVHPVEPTLTAVNHVALATGLPPARTGLVSNSFRHSGSAISERVSGFDAMYDGEALWTAAQLQDRRVGVLLWPGSDTSGLYRMADFGVLWPMRPLAPSEVVELAADKATPLPELSSCDGVEAVSWRLDIPLGPERAVELVVAVFDATPDGRPRYDEVAARLSSDPSWEHVAEYGWFPLTVTTRAPRDLRPRCYGAWSKVLRLDRFRGDLRLYRGALWRLVAYPDVFEDRLGDAIGFWPGPPDGEMIEQWWLDASAGIDLDTYLEQVERLDRYLDSMVTHVISSEGFDLLMSYHPTPDEYQHSSLIRTQEQWAYSPGCAIAAEEGLKRVGRSMDLSVGTLWRALDHQSDILVVVSDHGLAPIHEVVYLNEALAEAGLVVLEKRGSRLGIADRSPLAVTCSGACAHLYLNLEGREEHGVISSEAAPELLRRAAKVMADLVVDGRLVVERIVDRSEAAELGLDHPDSGDLIVFLNPGFTASDEVGGKVHEPSRYYGQHGYLSCHDAMSSIFFAAGPGVPRRHIDELRITEIAPLVAGWLGLTFPSGR
jgi:predicted AlkP superfamily pyrophosphatase or phosphodiesterase